MLGYILVLFAGLLSIMAQSYVQSSYNKYRRIGTRGNRTGAQIAQHILDTNNISDVKIVQSNRGVLSDHFDPTNKVIALSPDVYNGSSIASVAVAAHEVGHAIQYNQGYKGITIRNVLLKPTIIASQLSGMMIMMGMFFINSSLGWVFDLGLLMLFLITLFQLVTLPIEFDASSRALNNIESLQLVEQTEYNGAKTMLTAAALTYVAAAIGSIMNLLRFVAIRNDRQN